MSAVYNPEADLVAEIERLEREARDYRRKMEGAKNTDDKRVLSRQLQETQQRIDSLKSRLP